MTAGSLAATVYLDLDDPVAAMAVLGQVAGLTCVAQVKIAQYQRDRRRAAELARSVTRGPGNRAHLARRRSPPGRRHRDGRLCPGSQTTRSALFDDHAGTGPRVWSRGLGLVYAHTLVLAGETQRGRKLATSILVQLDAESVGRTENWFCRERAAAFAIMGDDERALAELAISQKMKKFYRWWYLAELDPLYERLRSDPRFQALAEQARKHRVEQRALVEQMRRKGEVPKRIQSRHVADP